MMKREEKESCKKPHLLYVGNRQAGERRLEIVSRRVQPIREGDSEPGVHPRCAPVIPMPRRDQAS